MPSCTAVCVVILDGKDRLGGSLGQLLVLFVLLVFLVLATARRLALLLVFLGLARLFAVRLRLLAMANLLSGACRRWWRRRRHGIPGLRHP